MQTAWNSILAVFALLYTPFVEAHKEKALNWVKETEFEAGHM